MDVVLLIHERSLPNSQTKQAKTMRNCLKEVKKKKVCFLRATEHRNPRKLTNFAFFITVVLLEMPDASAVQGSKVPLVKMGKSSS